MKVRLYYLRSVFLLFLVLSILSSTTLSVNAATYVKSVYWALSSAGSVHYNSANTTMDLVYDAEDVNGTSVYFYYLTSQQSIFTSDPDYYAYKVIMTPDQSNNTIYYNSYVMWARPIMGTYSDILSGAAQMGTGNTLESTPSSLAESSTFWIITDHSEVPIYAAVLMRCREYLASASNMYPTFSFDGDIQCSIYAYAEQDYINEMADKMEEGNQIAQEGNEIAQEGNDIAQEGNEIAQEGNEIAKDQLAEAEEQTETQKGILSSITDFFGSFFSNLIDAVIGLFIPSSEEMSELFSRLDQFFTDTFGFLYFPFDFLISVFNTLMNGNSGGQDTAINFPAFSIMGYQVWPDISYDITSNDVAMKVINFAHIVLQCSLAFYFIMYLRNFFDKRFGGGGN